MDDNIIYNDQDIKNINNKDFFIMLEFYKQYEKKAALILSQLLKCKDYIFNDDYRYDIKFNKLNLTFEIKNDNLMNKTGNIAIEYNYNNKSSGILTSQADYYIFNDRINYYMIETYILKQLIDSKKYIYVKNNNTYCYLIDNKLLLDNAINLTQLLIHYELNNKSVLSLLSFKNDYSNDINYNVKKSFAI